MKNNAAVIENFRRKGYKITPQRRAIIEILFNHENHPKAEDIFTEMKEKMPDISRTTVYNTLRELNEIGIIDVVRNIGETPSRFDPNTQEHDHLFCLSCHRIIDLETDFKDIDLSKKTSYGFQIVKKQVTFYGYCPECQKSREIN